jgi:hypothetical protein
MASVQLRNVTKAWGDVIQKQFFLILFHFLKHHH